MNISFIKIIQGKYVSDLETAIQDRLGAPFNNTPLKVCKVHPGSLVIDKNPYENAFAAEIDTTELVSFFKEAIKEKKQNDFAINIDTDKLKLAQVVEGRHFPRRKQKT